METRDDCQTTRKALLLSLKGHSLQDVAEKSIKTSCKPSRTLNGLDFLARHLFHFDFPPSRLHTLHGCHYELLREAFFQKQCPGQKILDWGLSKPVLLWYLCGVGPSPVSHGNICNNKPRFNLITVTGYSKKASAELFLCFLLVFIVVFFFQTRCIKFDFWNLRCLFYQVESILFHF